MEVPPTHATMLFEIKRRINPLNIATESVAQHFRAESDFEGSICPFTNMGAESALMCRPIVHPEPFLGIHRVGKSEKLHNYDKSMTTLIPRKI
jgi:hypothetical protein